MGNAGQPLGAGTVVMDHVVRGISGTLVQTPAAGRPAPPKRATAHEALAATAVPDSFAVTHVAPPADVGETQVAAPDVTLSSPASTTLSRSTVLPKSKVGGVAPALVHTDRPRYEKKGLLGEGGVGEVVKSIDNDIERPVAIKRLKADMRAPGHIARFVDEIRTIGSMEHPNIVPIHDVGVDEEGQYFFVMKYVEGETLESIMEKLAQGDILTHRRYGFERRVEIFVGVLEAISYAHARGIIHRDIKPANVMVGTWGEVTVMDWGLARTVKDKTPELPREGISDAIVDAGAPSRALFKTRAGTLLGTPAYMSPEQARGESLDERSDIYSLCVMLHEFLSLEHYLKDQTTLEGMLEGVQTVKHKGCTTISSQHQPPPPAELAHFVNKGLAKDPKDRYQSVVEMIERLRRRAAGEIPIECPVTFVKSFSMRWSTFIDRHPFFVVTLMMLGVLGGLGGGGVAIAHALH